MKLIGLHGRKRSGKSTVARLLCERHGFVEVSFAAPLYRALATMLRIDVRDLARDEIKDSPIPWLGKSPRQLLQTLGTEWGRSVREDLWIILAERDIATHRALGHERIVVSDVRFDNEARFVLDRGGEVWTIWRPNLDTSDTHASERGISDSLPARGIVNNGTIEELGERIRHLLARGGS